MHIDDGELPSKQGNVLFVPISITKRRTKHNIFLRKVIDKNISYLFLTPEESLVLRERTLYDLPDEMNNINYIVGVWSPNSEKNVVASIYQITDDGWKYLVSLPERPECRIGEFVDEA